MSELPALPDVAEQLHDVLVRLGRERMITRSALTRNVLKDLFPADQLAVSLLVAAVDHGAAMALDRQGADVDPGLLIPRLADDLARSRGLSFENATWAIDTWAQAMDLPDTPRPAPAATQDMPATSARATDLVGPGATPGGTVVAEPAGVEPQASPPQPVPEQAPPSPVLLPQAPVPDQAETPAVARRGRGRLALLAGIVVVLLSVVSIVWMEFRPDGSSRPTASGSSTPNSPEAAVRTWGNALLTKPGSESKWECAAGSPGGSALADNLDFDMATGVRAGPAVSAGTDRWEVRIFVQRSDGKSGASVQLLVVRESGMYLVC